MRLRDDFRMTVAFMGVPRRQVCHPKAMVRNEYGVCRVRIFEPESAEGHHVVLIEDLLENDGPSTVDAIGQIVDDLIFSHRDTLDLKTTLFFEYRPSAVRGGDVATLDQAVVSWREQSRRLRGSEDDVVVTGVGWRHFDVESFERLVGKSLSP